MSSGKIIVLEKVDSTNNYAMGLIRNGKLRHGQAVFAREQTAGKGRRGREWASAAGENLILSTAIEMNWQPLLQQFPLSVGAALACHDLVTSLVKQKVYLKWPNDIYIYDSKAGGVLIENVVKGTLWQWAVVGVGININQVEHLPARAVSVRILTGEEQALFPLAEKLRLALLKRIDQLKGGNFADMLKEYNQHLYARDKKVIMEHQNQIFETTIIAVTATGELTTQDIKERHFRFDEVNFLGLA